VTFVAHYRVGLQTRARILTATRELLGEVGFDGVTLKAITDRAGVGAGSFYNLFDSKEQAVLEVVRDAITAVDPDPSGLGRETVEDLTDAFVAFFTSSETATVARIYLQLAFAGGLTDEAMASRVRRSHRARVARFADAVARERARPGGGEGMCGAAPRRPVGCSRHLAARRRVGPRGARRGTARSGGAGARGAHLGVTPAAPCCRRRVMDATAGSSLHESPPPFLTGPV
jgi:AcrR family transcriptional regulator